MTEKRTILVMDGPDLNVGNNEHVPTVIGKARMQDLCGGFEIPVRQAGTNIGYQRAHSKSRVRKLAEALRVKRVDLPTAVLLNRRNLKLSSVAPIETRVGNLRQLAVSPGDPFQVVDGQHRLKALELLFGEDPDHWGSFEISFVCMVGATEHQEMNQFYVVNSTAKSISTDLAHDLLKQRAVQNHDVWEDLVATGKSWQVDGQELTEEVENHSHNWRGRIRFSNMDKGDTTVGSAGFVKSLKVPLSQITFNRLSLADKVSVLDSYWEGVRRVYKPAFDDPGDYNVQKQTGVTVLHALLPDVMFEALAQGSTKDPNVYADILREPLSEIEGENVDGDTVQGVEFWRVGKGAAGSFSSEAGRRILIQKLKKLIGNTST